MSSRNKAAAALLAITVGAGIYCLHVLGLRPDGVLPRLRDNGTSAFPKWPGTTRPLKRAYTGLKPVDKIFSSLNPFFAPVLDGSDPSLSLWGIFMFGQYGISFGLSVLESYRFGNRGKAISFITSFFILGQLVGWAVAFPIWTFIYTLTSPLSTHQPTPTQSQNTFIAIKNLKALPYTITLSYIIPSLLPLLTSNPSTRQTLLAIWQPFPLWTYILQTLFTLFSSSTSSSPSNQQPPRTRLETKTYTQHLQKVYTFLLFFGTLTNLTALTLTLYPSLLNLISSPLAKALISHNPTISSVYIPHPPVPSYRAKSLADGVHIFLWWDTYVSSTAGFIWAVALWRGVDGNVTGVVGKVALWSVLAGPWGGILTLIKERDLIALNAEKRLE